LGLNEHQVKKRKTKFKKQNQTFRPRNVRTVIVASKALAEPMCESEGLELVHLEYQREPSGWIMRLYIDKPGGITLDDCANVSHQMNVLLDVHLDEIGPYNLEVTSPGPDRPLAKKQDFERFKGNPAKIRTIRPYEGQKNFKGVLMGVSGAQVKLLVGEETVQILLRDISKASLINFTGES
jgi:ribosome maturation factor RimP